MEKFIEKDQKLKFFLVNLWKNLSSGYIAQHSFKAEKNRAKIRKELHDLILEIYDFDLKEE